MTKRKKTAHPLPAADQSYRDFLSDLSGLLDQARRAAARTINGILTATYWEIGRRIVEFEQGGQARAAYGEELLKRLGHDLAAKHGRGFSERNLESMRRFYLGWQISQTLSAKFEVRAASPEPGEGPSCPLRQWMPSPLPPRSRCHGLTTSVSCQSRTSTPGSSTRRRRSVVGGPSVN